MKTGLLLAALLLGTVAAHAQTSSASAATAARPVVSSTAPIVMDAAPIQMEGAPEASEQLPKASGGVPEASETTPKTPETPPTAPDKDLKASPANPDSTTNKTAPPNAAALTAEKTAPVRLKRFETRPVIDGKLDDDAWKQAPVLADFLQTNPGDNSAPSQPTEVFIGYDAKFLYVAFRARDEPGQVRATVAKRDSVLEDDNVRILLDTFNDQRRAYQLIFNPLGVQQDGIYTEDRGDDFSVDIVMESKGAITSDGYVVEVAIPFKSLRYEAGKDKVWGFHALRKIKRFNNETDSWMPHSRSKSGWLNQAGRITGLEGISTERTLEIIPSLTISETGRRVRTLPRSLVRANAALVDPGRIVNEAVTLDPGLTMKLGITPTVTLDFAYNPDFAQVEADASVVTANQRFPIFFEEKRPFFLEGIDIFNTTMNVVNTRAIVDPDYAVKLSGKRGRNSFGIMLASDNAPGNFSEEERTDPELRAPIEQFIDRNASIGVLRLKRDIGKESNIGLFATTYNFVEKRNHLGGFDGRFRLDPQTTFSFQVVGTNSRRLFYDPDRDEKIHRTGNAFGYVGLIEKETRNFYLSLLAVGRTRDYRADVGFTRRVDTNSNEFFIRYNSDPRTKGKFTNVSVSSFSRAQYDWQGRVQGWNTGVRSFFNFRRQSWLGVGFDNYYERIYEDEFGARRNASRRGAFDGAPDRAAHNKALFFSGGSTPSKKYSFWMDVFYNIGALDFDFGSGSRFPRVSPAALRDPDSKLDPGPGDMLNIYSNFNYQPIDALRMSLNYTKSRLVRHDTGRTAFDVNIYSLRSTYQFTRFTFARARIDYNTLASNIRAQFLAGWTPNPGTSFFVGYNDDLNRNGFNPFTGNLEPGLRRNGRTFFIKMSYLFQRSL